MSSKSDKKKSRSKREKIKLTEIAREEILSPESVQTAQSEKYKVKILAGFDGQDDKKYEDSAAAELNSAAGDDYELMCVLPSADSKNLIAFFKLSK